MTHLLRRSCSFCFKQTSCSLFAPPSAQHRHSVELHIRSSNSNVDGWLRIITANRLPSLVWTSFDIPELKKGKDQVYEPMGRGEQTRLDLDASVEQPLDQRVTHVTRDVAMGVSFTWGDHFGAEARRVLQKALDMFLTSPLAFSTTF